MNSMLEFTSDFWSWYITVITIVSLVGVAIFLYSQRTQRLAPGQKAEEMAHKWDGDLVELNNPLPSWWVKLFWITLIFAGVYLVLYPGLGSFKGALNWSSWGQYNGEINEAKAKYDPVFNQFLNEPIQQVAANKDAHEMGQRLFMTYCSQCHQSDAKGARGFPNLTDSDWLYGGAPETIEATISTGRAGVMPAWEPILGADGVKEVASYVMWLYGGSEAAIMETISKGRNGTMPAQLDRLGAAKVHLLAAYVWGLGGGQQPAPAPEAAAPAAPAEGAAPEAVAPAVPAEGAAK
jgi:cytochrome c oxidase cbb3-type subunit 3